MRTTVTLDADTERLIRVRMRERGQSFKAALNEAIRAGLSPIREGREGYRVPVSSMGVPTVNLDKALALASALEDEELIRKSRLGK